MLYQNPLVQSLNTPRKPENISLNPTLPVLACESDHCIETKVLRGDGIPTKSNYVDETILQIE